jgi:hypothetical protein
MALGSDALENEDVEEEAGVTIGENENGEFWRRTGRRSRFRSWVVAIVEGLRRGNNMLCESERRIDES